MTVSSRSDSDEYPDATGHWEWQDDGGWMRFSPAVASQIQQAWPGADGSDAKQTGSPTYEFKAPNNQMYEIDVASSTQRNRRYGTVRPMRLKDELYEWQDEHNAWHAYSDEVQDGLSALVAARLRPDITFVHGRQTYRL